MKEKINIKKNNNEELVNKPTETVCGCTRALNMKKEELADSKKYRNFSLIGAIATGVITAGGVIIAAVTKNALFAFSTPLTIASVYSGVQAVKYNSECKKLKKEIEKRESHITACHARAASSGGCCKSKQPQPQEQQNSN